MSKLYPKKAAAVTLRRKRGPKDYIGEAMARMEMYDALAAEIKSGSDHAFDQRAFLEAIRVTSMVISGLGKPKGACA
ncbi:hypothetical protein [Hydrocarboniphaga effusa]|uniref:hypothetical protein n=1 Tax=Hydrocarboniphaga effusa TaxID=243629 RepID=UPI00398C052C